MSTPPPFGGTSAPSPGPSQSPPAGGYGPPGPPPPGFAPTAQPGPVPGPGAPQGQPGAGAQPGYGPPGAPPPGWGGPAQGWAAGAERPPAAAPQTTLTIAQILCPVLVIAGLTIPQNGSIGWADYTLWAIFAAVMSLAQLITLARDRDPAQSGVIRTIATGALVAYWVVIVLPGISSNGGFLQTLGVGCAVVAAWLGGSRR